MRVISHKGYFCKQHGAPVRTSGGACVYSRGCLCVQQGVLVCMAGGASMYSREC